MSEIPDLPPVLERLLGSGYHEQIGAFALESLPPEERIAFESHLRDCEQCQDELPALLDAVRILRRAIVPESELRERVEPAAAAPAPSTRESTESVEELADFAESEAAADIPAADSEDSEAIEESGDTVDEAASVIADSLDSPYAQPADIDEDLAPGVAAPGAETALTGTTAGPTVSELLDDLPPIDQKLLAETEPIDNESAEIPAPAQRGRLRSKAAPSATRATAPTPAAPVVRAQTPPKLPWILGGLGLLFGIGAIIAALALAETKGNLEEEISFQNSHIAELNTQRDTYLQQTTAITWTLEPTTLGTPGSGGIVFADPAGTSAVLSVHGLAPLGSDQMYQVWYVPPQPGLSVIGPALTLDSSGNAVVALQPDLSPYEAVAVTIEPAGGSELPSTNPVLQGFFTSS